jgi:ribosomal protein L11 methyltransferase
MVSEALQPFAISVASFGASADGPWTVEAYADAPPDHEALGGALVDTASAAGIDVPDLQVEPLATADWLRANRESFQPIRAGRYFVYPSHYEDAMPSGAVAICIDAATAFGSGTHGSTQGCLLALDLLMPAIGHGLLLDVGCGSGILSIAMARTGGHAVLAVDISEEAIRVCRKNARINGVGDRVHAFRGGGLRDRRVAINGPYPMIVANILARPLMEMARDIAANVELGGFVVLSGLLIGQEVQVLGAYRRCGLSLHDRVTVGGWRTLILRR